VGKVLHVRVLPPVPLGLFVEIALFALGALALGVQAAAAREGVNVSYAGWVGFAIALALYLPHHFSPSDPLGGVFGALLVALAVGGIGGWIAGTLTSRFAAG
jgi:ribose/xylose/arabinose/galactoside ABC-type transport system permease subunit